MPDCASGVASGASGGTGDGSGGASRRSSASGGGGEQTGERPMAGALQNSSPDVVVVRRGSDDDDAALDAGWGGGAQPAQVRGSLAGTAPPARPRQGPAAEARWRPLAARAGALLSLALIAVDFALYLARPNPSLAAGFAPPGAGASAAAWRAALAGAAPAPAFTGGAPGWESALGLRSPWICWDLAATALLSLELAARHDAERRRRRAGRASPAAPAAAAKPRGLPRSYASMRIDLAVLVVAWLDIALSPWGARMTLRPLRVLYLAAALADALGAGHALSFAAQAHARPPSLAPSCRPQGCVPCEAV